MKAKEFRDLFNVKLYSKTSSFVIFYYLMRQERIFRHLLNTNKLSFAILAYKRKWTERPDLFIYRIDTFIRFYTKLILPERQTTSSFDNFKTIVKDYGENVQS